jgi:superfamily II DNA or RNA helicase
MVTVNNTELVSYSSACGHEAGVGGLFPLRPHQALALDELRRAISSGKRSPLIQAPTGYGKTVLAAHIVAGALAKWKRVAFVAPSLGLIDQTFERFVENGIDAGNMGVMQANHPWTRPQAMVQICSVQTLARRQVPDVDVAIIDEAHIRNKVYDTWIGGKVAANDNLLDVPQKKPLFIGLSATPWSRGLGRLFDQLIKPTSLKELIDQGYLSPFRVFAPSAPDLSKVKTRYGDYVEAALADAMDKPDLTGDVVSTWLRLAKGLPTLCFAVNRRHAKSLHDAFAECGVSSAYVDAHTPRDERDRLGRELEAGNLDVICNIGCLTTGIDWDVRCIILARPTKSEMLFTQIIGRGLRTAPGKEECLILDHTGTHERLGFVTDIDRDGLDAGKAGKGEAERQKREKKEPLPACCPNCTAMMPRSENACLACGHEMPKPPELEHAEGELEEVPRDGEKVAAKPPSVRALLRRKGKQRVYSELATIQIDKGYKSGWTAHKYKEIFEVWPRNLEDVPAPPSPEVLRWVKSRQISYAKGHAGGVHVAA